MIRLIALLILAAAPLAGCTKNAATGKTIFTMGMSRNAEIALGAEAAPQFTQEYGGKVEHAGLQKYVTDIGQKMAKETEGENVTLPWEFTLLNTDAVNAFALPGGKVFFTRGLAERLTTEAQMAGVLGHEIGHVTAQHGAQRIASSTAFQVGLAVGAAVVQVSDNERVRQIGGYGVPALAVSGQLVQLKFGRDEELEADRLGVRYMANVGYNPRGQLEVMQVLQSLSAGGTRQPEFLSTHPDPGARIEQVQHLLNTEYASTQNNPKFGDFKERYKTQFLDVIKTIPKPPAQKGAALGTTGTLADLGDPAGWCGFCAAAKHSAAHAPEAGPVPPREGIYVFFAPPAP